MAHCEKYGRPAIGHMLDHYARECEATLQRENVHEGETGRNYAIAYGKDGGIHEYEPKMLSRSVKSTITKAVQAHEKNTGKKLRKDGVVMCDWVVTLPDDWPDDRDPQEFFTNTLRFARERYGRACVTGGFVHLDETTPHMHLPVIPMIDPEGADKPRLCAKKKISRTDLRSFHQDLQAYLLERDIPGTLTGKRRKNRPKYTNKMTQAELQEYDRDIENAKQEGIALGRAESLSKAADLQKQVYELESKNKGLRANLKAVESTLHLSEYVYEKTDTFEDALRNYCEVQSTQTEALLEDRRALVKLRAEHSAKQTQRENVKSEARRKMEAQLKASGDYIREKARREAEGDYGYGG